MQKRFAKSALSSALAVAIFGMAVSAMAQEQGADKLHDVLDVQVGHAEPTVFNRLAGCLEY